MKKSIAVFLILQIFLNCQSQESIRQPVLRNYFDYGVTCWAAIGIGTAVMSDIALQLGGEISFRSHVLGGFTEKNTEFNFLGPVPPEKAEQISFYYGKRISGKFNSFSVSAGGGAIDFTTRTHLLSTGFFSSTYESVSRTYACADLLIKGNFEYHGTGIGMQVHGNLNEYRPFLTVTLLGQFGFKWNRNSPPGE